MSAQATRVSQALEKLSCDLEPELLDGRDAARLLEMVARWEKVCASLRARLARRVDETKVWRDGGHRSAAHFIAETAGTTVGAATRSFETARAPRIYPRPRRRSGQANSRRRRRQRSRRRRATIPLRKPRSWKRQLRRV